MQATRNSCTALSSHPLDLRVIHHVAKYFAFCDACCQPQDCCKLARTRRQKQMHINPGRHHLPIGIEGPVY